MMDDYISRRDAIDAVIRFSTEEGASVQCTDLYTEINSLPSAQTEPTRIISEMKAIPSDDDRVSLSETVTATYYDEEHEEWSRKIATVRDVLDSVCDEYTVLPSAEPEIIRCKDCKQFRRWIDTDICFCDIIESERLDNDYCSRAERRGKS